MPASTILNLTKVTKTSWTSGASIMTNTKPGNVTVSLDMFSQPISGYGAIASLEFKAVGGAGSFSELNLLDIDFSDYNALTLSTIGGGAIVNIEETLPTVNVTIVIQDKVRVNSTFTATIDVSEVKQLAWAQFTISYNSSVVNVNNIKSVSADASVLTSVNNTAGVAVVQLDMFNKPVDGPVSIGIINFTVVGSLGDSTILLLSNLDFSDYKSGNILVSEVNNATVTILMKFSGDVTGDGDVTGTDVVKFKRILLGVDETPLGADLDLNNDGKVTGADIIILKRRMLGLD